MDVYTSALMGALISLILTGERGLIRIGRGHVELTETITSPVNTQYVCCHYNEVGRYTMLQFVEWRKGSFTNYQEVMK